MQFKPSSQSPKRKQSHLKIQQSVNLATPLHMNDMIKQMRKGSVVEISSPVRMFTPKMEVDNLNLKNESKITRA